MIGRLLQVATVLVSVAVALALGEGFLRLKNRSMTNYDIEMWRYSSQLKVPSDNPILDFDHARSKSAQLQNVDIRLNELGLRGGPVEPLPPGARRILFLGSSIALGWGVHEADTVSVRLQHLLEQDGRAAQVLNGGIGNYNAERYVTRFFADLAPLKPTDLVVHYFLRDAEPLAPASRNLLLKHSQFAVTLWVAYHRLFDAAGETNLVDHYRRIYDRDTAGFAVMKSKLKALADYGRAEHIRLYLAMTPDIHNLVDYPLGFAHDAMRDVARELGYTYVDLLPALAGRRADELFAMPGDPHPNALGHKLMAEALYPVLSLTRSTSQGQ